MKKKRPVPLNAIPTRRPAPLANAAIENSPVVTVDVNKLASFTFILVLNRFTFIANLS